MESCKSFEPAPGPALSCWAEVLASRFAVRPALVQDIALLSKPGRGDRESRVPVPVTMPIQAVDCA